MSLFLEDLSLLLVEPSNTQRKILGDQLEPLHLREVLTVSTMNEALQTLGHNQPHVVLSAMHLPDGRGYDLLTAIRAHPTASSTAFVLISSETRASELEPIRQGGTAAIIEKPCTRDDLRRALMDILDLMSTDSLHLEEEDIEDIRCLIVDDSRAARSFMTRVLKQLGIEQLDEACDGTEAVEMMSERFFDLIVTDYHMPKMNGFELLEYIRTKSSQPQIPVLMVTSDQNGARVAGVERHGISAVIDKPFAMEDVRRILENVFS